MSDLEEVMWEAWERVGAGILSDPAELSRRLGRRRGASFAKRPRAFCFAIRASDRRINLATAIIVPEGAAYPGCPQRYGEHDVYLNKKLFLALGGAVVAEGPGEFVQDVAERLGCVGQGLRPLWRNGTLQVKFVKGIGGRRGKPVPLVWRNGMLDPSARGKRPPDPIWGGLWVLNGEGMRDDFCQKVRRVPEWRTRNGRVFWVGWRWECPVCGNNVRTIYYPKPVPDWGDWLRSCGRLTAEQVKMLRLGRPEDYVAPMEVPRDDPDDWYEENGFGQSGDGGRFLQEEAPAPRPVPKSRWKNALGFACRECHWVVNFSRASLTASWNLLVLKYSGGLLYGSEVRRPEWLVQERMREYRPHRQPRAAPRREQLTRLLVGTKLLLREIAREMGLTLGTVVAWSSRIYDRHGVSSREELRRARPELMVGVTSGRRAG